MIENQYYRPQYNLDGTADDLFIQARNGYITDPDALREIQNILCMEKAFKKAEYVGYLADQIEEEQSFDCSRYSLNQLKIDFLNKTGGLDSVTLEDGTSLYISSDFQSDVIISLSKTVHEEDELVTYENSITLDFQDFYKLSRQSFDLLLNSIHFYMQETDREPAMETQEDRDLE